MLNLEHFRIHVVRATLTYLGLWSEAAENLLVGTAIVESGLRHLRQLGNGPARGFFQIEPLTHDDIKRYLRNRPKLRAKVSALRAEQPPEIDQLIINLAYGCAIARIKYWMDPEPLPSADDIDGLGRYYKRVYNTAKGKGNRKRFVALYRRHALGETGHEPA